jgi:hypothetical protein
VTWPQSNDLIGEKTLCSNNDIQRLFAVTIPNANRFEKNQAVFVSLVVCRRTLMLELEKRDSQELGMLPCKFANDGSAYRLFYAVEANRSSSTSSFSHDTKCIRT